MSDPVWFPESRPIPEELEDDYTAATYREPTFFPPLADRLDTAMRQRLLEYSAGLGDTMILKDAIDTDHV